MIPDERPSATVPSSSTAAAVTSPASGLSCATATCVPPPSVRHSLVTAPSPTTATYSPFGLTATVPWQPGSVKAARPASGGAALNSSLSSSLRAESSKLGPTLQTATLSPQPPLTTRMPSLEIATDWAPISSTRRTCVSVSGSNTSIATPPAASLQAGRWSHGPLQSRSEEHTSELQSPCNLVCRLLLETKK